MTLAVSVRHRQGGFSLEAAFESSGRLTALFGPSGSGKTTLVNVIAGLVRPQEGYVAVAERTLVDTNRRVFVPAHRRRIGYVFQDARLFPHLNVGQNLRYGRYFTPARHRYADFSAVVDLLGIGHLLDRRPATLSGGERQRVAIGRALIASPHLILMDEPLASLDDTRKAEILPHLERLRDEMRIPIVYVSHSLAEVSRLATDVVLLSGGRVTASGAAQEVLSTLGRTAINGDGERNGPFALVELEAVETEPDGLVLLRSAAGEWRLALPGIASGTTVRAKVAASDVMIAIEPPRGISALNVIACVVEEIRQDASGRPLVVLATGSDRLLASVTGRSVDALGLGPGRAVFAVVKSVAVDSLPMMRG